MAAGDLSARAAVTRQDEIGELGQAFNMMAQRVENTVNALRRFVADAAHELNTPLTALRTDLELAAAEAPDTPFLAVAQQQAMRLQTLTRDLLQLSRLESDTSPALHPLDWTELIRQRSELVAARAEQAGLNFTLDVPETRVVVLGHEEQLVRAFDNLLDNALKFTPLGGDIDVVLAVDQTTATLAVSDSGIGIDGEGTHLFERFHRAPNAAGYAGSGLGLAIVHSIALAHHGTIRAERLAGGTRFLFTLPVSPA
jgi:two-component system sensor histidine kinase MprB